MIVFILFWLLFNFYRYVYYYRERYRKKRFDESLQSHRSELIAVYGRRRIGKTYLIRSYFSKHILFSLTGLRNGSLSAQLENFMIELSRLSKQPYTKNPDSWLEAF